LLAVKHRQFHPSFRERSRRPFRAIFQPRTSWSGWSLFPSTIKASALRSPASGPFAFVMSSPLARTCRSKERSRVL